MSPASFRVTATVAGLAASSAGAEILNNARFGVSLAVPEGFKQGMPPKPEVLFAFSKPLPDGSIVVTVEHIGGTIGRERLQIPDDTSKLQSLPGMSGARLSVEDANWRSFPISVLRSDMKVNGADWLVLGAQVPLVPEAVTINVGAPKTHELELRSTLAFVLTNLDGKTNWLTDAERQERLQSGLLKIGTWVLVLALVGLFALRALKRKQPSRS
jgi:hypothetical protein